MNAIAICFALSPLSYVGIAEDTLPNTLTLFQAVLPFTLVDFSVYPSVYTLSMWFVVFEFTFVSIAVAVPFHAPAVSVIT